MPPRENREVQHYLQQVLQAQQAPQVPQVPQQLTRGELWVMQGHPEHVVQPVETARQAVEPNLFNFLFITMFTAAGVLITGNNGASQQQCVERSDLHDTKTAIVYATAGSFLLKCAGRRTDIRDTVSGFAAGNAIGRIAVKYFGI